MNKQIQKPTKQTKSQPAHPLNSVMAYECNIVDKKDLLASACPPSVASQELQVESDLPASPPVFFQPAFLHYSSDLPFFPLLLH